LGSACAWSARSARRAAANTVAAFAFRSEVGVPHAVRAPRDLGVASVLQKCRECGGFGRRIIA